MDGLEISRDAFIEELTKAGIGVSVHFIPIHMMPYYRKKYNLDFPVAEKVFNSAISLPIFPGMTSKQMGRVIDSVLSIGERFHK